MTFKPLHLPPTHPITIHTPNNHPHTHRPARFDDLVDVKQHTHTLINLFDDLVDEQTNKHTDQLSLMTWWMSNSNAACRMLSNSGKLSLGRLYTAWHGCNRQVYMRASVSFTESLIASLSHTTDYHTSSTVTHN